MTLLPAKNLGKNQNPAESLSRKPFFAHSKLDRKQEIRLAVSEDAIYDTQSCQD